MKVLSKTIEKPQTIGPHLRKRRLEKKLLQKDVAAMFNVSEDTITGWNGGCNRLMLTANAGNESRS